MPSLFDPGRIGSLELKNRLVRSATGAGMSLPDGSMTPELVEIYRQLADGGVGLIITGHACVAPNGKASAGMMGLWKDGLVPGLSKMVDVVHDHGSQVAAQINHAGRQTTPETTGETPVAPSPIPQKGSDIVPRALTEGEIRDLLHAYAQAARRAKEAGFDGVQLHCAHGYLMSEFISPYTNHRTDDWGGSPKKRHRFVLEAYRKVREAVGSDYPVFIKQNGADFIDGGLELEESVMLAEALDAEGIDAIEVSCGMTEVAAKIARINIRTPKKEAYLLPLAEEFRKHLSCPIILVGGMRSRATMQRILDGGKVDFISICRPLIREPDLPKKLKKGQSAATCASCNACFTHRPGPLRCMYEERFGKPPREWKG